jgi:hypothetical protein
MAHVPSAKSVSAFTPEQRARLQEAARLIESVAAELDTTSHVCTECGLNVAHNLTDRFTHPQLLGMARKLSIYAKPPERRPKT